MPNFVKIARQIKKFSIQALDSDRLVCMPAICCSGPITAVATNEQILGEKRTRAKFQIDIDKWTYGQTEIIKSSQLVTLITLYHLIWFPMFPSGFYKLHAHLIYPVQGIETLL